MKQEIENIFPTFGNCSGLNHQISGMGKKEIIFILLFLKRASIGKFEKYYSSMRKLSYVGVSTISQEDRIHSRSFRGNLIQEMVYECCQGIRSKGEGEETLRVVTTGS